MDKRGRGDQPPVTAVPGDGAPAGREVVAAGRLDDWWDPAWDAAWWDPAWNWNADSPAAAPAPVAALGQPGEAALAAADSAEPGILPSPPDASSGHVTGPAVAIPAGPAIAVPAVQAIAVPAVQAVAVPAAPAAVPGTPPTAAADPSWGQVLATTISLWMSRRRPQVGTIAVPDNGRVPDDAGQRGTGFRWPLRHPSGRRPRPAARGRAVPGVPTRRPRLACGAVPWRGCPRAVLASWRGGAPYPSGCWRPRC